MEYTQHWVTDQLKNDCIVLSDPIAWFWFNGAGNHAGLFLSGEHKGAITKYFHEDPETRPAYGSVYGSMATLLKYGYMDETEDAVPATSMCYPKRCLDDANRGAHQPIEPVSR